MIKYILVLLILGSFSLFTTSSFAQNKRELPIKQVLRVSPVILDSQLKIGHNKFEIKIDNLLDIPLGIGAKAENFDPLDEEDNLQKTTALRNVLTDWTNILDSNILINPKESKSVLIDIAVPKNAKNGGYSEIIFFTPIYFKKPETSSPTVLGRVGALVLANLGKTNYNDLSKKVNVKSFNFTELFYEKEPINVKFKVENNYFNHFSAKPFLTISPLFGKEQAFIFEEKHILPEQTRSWSENLELKHPSIFYKAKLAVSVGGGNRIFANSYFFVFPIRKALVIFGIVIIIFILLLRAKQIRRALNILVKGD